MNPSASGPSPTSPSSAPPAWLAIAGPTASGKTALALALAVLGLGQVGWLSRIGILAVLGVGAMVAEWRIGRSSWPRAGGPSRELAEDPSPGRCAADLPHEGGRARSCQPRPGKGTVRQHEPGRLITAG